MKIKVILATSLLLLTTTSKAAIPVIDVASIARLVTQFQQLQQQYLLLQNQFDSLNGDTAFSGFMEDTVRDAHSFVPSAIGTDVRDVIKHGSGVSGLKALAEKLQSEQQTVKVADIFKDAAKDSKAREDLERTSDEIFSVMAMAQNAFNVSGSRKIYLDQLRKAIKNAESPKEREQLAIRVSVENTLLLNDVQQLLALQLLTQQQTKATVFNRQLQTKRARPAANQ